jgi:hypothetical protein
MAEVRRTGDHSIWFNSRNYRQQSDEALLESLNALQGGQQIALIFNGVRGIWARYTNGQVALRAVGQAARQSWQLTANRRGNWFPLALPPDEEPSPPAPPDSASDTLPRPDVGLPRPAIDPANQARKITFHPTKRYARDSGSILCLGLDMAWCGGRRADPDSQNDALSCLVIGDDNSAVQTQRVSLAETYDRSANGFTANCDPDAEVILGAINKTIEEHKASQIVLAVDAPLIATTRNLPQRSKNAHRGTLARRQPENALQEAISAGSADWRRACKIQPGAPIFSRVRALVDALTTRFGFQRYSHSSSDTPDKSLIECFPSEAIWALGCLNHYGTITAEQAREYKNEKFERGLFPWPLLVHAAHLNLTGFISALGVPGPSVRAWIAQISSALLTDPRLGDNTGKLMRGGKLFDDLIDSVNCLFTAVSFSHNTSHVWLGADLEDGHIIGPGR